MKTLEIAHASKPLAEYAQELQDDMVVLMSGNEPIAALVSLKNVEGLDLELFSLNANPEFMKIVEKSRRELRNGRKLSLDEMEREFQ